VGPCPPTPYVRLFFFFFFTMSLAGEISKLFSLCPLPVNIAITIGVVHSRSGWLVMVLIFILAFNC